MKKAWKSRLLISTVALVLVSTFLVAGTLSRYLTTIMSGGSINGTYFNFNENGTQTWDADLVALGATADFRDEQYGGEGEYETPEGGRMLAPGQSGYFHVAVSFVATVDSVADASATVFEGTGAFADFGTSLDGVAMRFIVSDDEILNPDFSTPYSEQNPYGYVNASGFEARLESVMENFFGTDGYYRSQENPVRVTDVMYVYWEWLDIDTPEANAADTDLGHAIHDSFVDTKLNLSLSVTVSQVELD